MAVAQRKVTYDELCRRPDDGILYELLDGELVPRASPTPAPPPYGVSSTVR